MPTPAPESNHTADAPAGVCRAGAAASFILLAYCLATMVQMIALGGPPSSAAESFRLLQANRLLGLLRLDLPTALALPLYYVLFLALSAALWRADRVKAILSALLVFTGVTLVLSAPGALSMAALSDRYAAATTGAARSQLLAAGEAVLAADMWHGTGAWVGGALGQIGALLICIPMLRATAFGRLAGWLGLLMHGLDLAHILAGPFVPLAGVILMAVAGPLYLPWFFLVGRGLLREARTASGTGPFTAAARA